MKLPAKVLVGSIVLAVIAPACWAFVSPGLLTVSVAVIALVIGITLLALLREHRHCTPVQATAADNAPYANRLLHLHQQLACGCITPSEYADAVRKLHS